MSTICQLMIEDFLYGTGRYDEETWELRYTDHNLEDGIAFMEWEKEMGRKKNLLYGFDLDSFIRWAKKKLRGW